MKKLIILSLLIYSTFTFSQTSMPAFFSDHMVLQQNEMVSVWGTDQPNVQVEISGSWGEIVKVKSAKNGKWLTKIQTPSAGGPYKLTISGSTDFVLEDILIGEVWLCSGQSNMQMTLDGFNNQPINGSNEAILNSTNDQIRFFTASRASVIEPQANVKGEWTAAAPSTVKNFSAVAYFYGKKLHDVLGIPIGLIHTSWGGSKIEAWMDDATLSDLLATVPSLEFPDTAPHKAPSLLYNGMLHPFIGYTIKGAIWYQGESNRAHPEDYSALLTSMVSSWRSQWNQGSFPFYYVQIAPYNYGSLNTAFLREAQLKSMDLIENSGMAVTMDIGDPKCIHPGEKKTVSDRLAYWALVNEYGYDMIACRGPEYKDMKLGDDAMVILDFDYVAGGLTSFRKELTGFKIAGEDKVFHAAQAKINKDKTLSVWSSLVKEPLAVRYAFDNCTAGSLFGARGLPVSSFRTDKWEQ